MALLHVLLAGAGGCDSSADSSPALTAERAAQALKAAGYNGLDTGELVEAVHASGVKRWEDPRIAKSSVASSCTHDPAFVRLQKGRFALRALRPDLEVMPSHALWSGRFSCTCFSGPASVNTLASCCACGRTWR